jgi:hypothetical protein
MNRFDALLLKKIKQSLLVQHRMAFEFSLWRHGAVEETPLFSILTLNLNLNLIHVFVPLCLCRPVHKTNAKEFEDFCTFCDGAKSDQQDQKSRETSNLLVFRSVPFHAGHSFQCCSIFLAVEEITAITTLRGFDLSHLLVLHTPPNFVYIIFRCYIRMLQPYMGVTSSAYGGSP